MFRFNIHLALTYHLAHVFIGRSFIFASPHTDSPHTIPEQGPSEWSALRTSLVSGCVQSALDIVDLCQTLQDQAGLARASYTEFTSCRAALLVILAQRIYERNARLRKASEQGIELLRHMSLGFYAADSEKSAIQAMETAIQAMETAIRRLDDGSPSDKPGPAGSNVSAYDRFRNWAMLWKNESNEKSDTVDSSSSGVNTELPAPIDPSSFSTLSPLQNFSWDLYSPFFALEAGDEFSFTGVDV